jgi:hypothetical protein
MLMLAHRLGEEAHDRLRYQNMQALWESGSMSDYDTGYFEGIRMVVLRKLQNKESEEDFINWLNEELKEALRLRDENYE